MNIHARNYENNSLFAFDTHQTISNQSPAFFSDCVWYIELTRLEISKTRYPSTPEMRVWINIISHVYKDFQLGQIIGPLKL